MTHLVVVCGHPASGKSSLASHLSRELGIPLVAKDDIKERLFDSLGTGDLDWSHRLGSASFAVLFDQVERHLQIGCDVIAEGNFRPDWAGADFDTILERTGGAVVTVVLDADIDVLQARFEERARSGERHPGHHAWVDAPDAWEPYRPPELPGPSIVVDTNDMDAIDLDDVVARVREALGRRRAP